MMAYLTNSSNTIATNVSLGGTFIFNGVSHTTANISSNGFIYFSADDLSSEVHPLTVRAWKVLSPFGGDLKTTADGVTVVTDSNICTVHFNCYHNKTATTNVLQFEVVIYLNEHGSPSLRNRVDYYYVSSTARQLSGSYYTGFSNAVIFNYMSDADTLAFHQGNAAINSSNKFPANATRISNVLNINPATILVNADDGTAVELPLGGTFSISGDYTTCSVTSNGIVAFGEYMVPNAYRLYDYSSYRCLGPFNGDLKTTSDGVTLATSDNVCTITFNCYSNKTSTENVLQFAVVLYLNGHVSSGNVDYVFVSSSSSRSRSRSTFTGNYYIGYAIQNLCGCIKRIDQLDRITNGTSAVGYSYELGYPYTNLFPPNGTRINDITSTEFFDDGIYLAGEDDNSKIIDIGGTFHWGTDYTQVTINTNGYIYFGEISDGDIFQPVESINKVLSIFNTDMVILSDGIEVTRNTEQHYCRIRYNYYSYYDDNRSPIVNDIVLYYKTHPYTPNKIQFKYVSSENTITTGLIGYVSGATRKIVTNFAPLTINSASISDSVPSGILQPLDGSSISLDIDIDVTGSIVLSPSVTITTSDQYFNYSDSLEITGTNFDLVSSIYFVYQHRIVNCTVTSRTNTALSISSPDIIGKASLILESQTNTVNFSCTFYERLVLTDVTPSGNLGKKVPDTVVITGTNLDQVTTVLFGTAESTIIRRKATLLKVIPPVLNITESQILDIVAFSKYGYEVTLDNAYEYTKNI